MVRLPKWSVDRSTIEWLTEREVGEVLRQAQQTSPNHHALIALMAMLGLRVSEACGIQIEDMRMDPTSHYMLITVNRKGGWSEDVPVPMPLLRVIEFARGDRTDGPLIRTRRGRQQTRNGAYLWVRTLCRKAGLREGIHPHSFRHAHATALLNAGVSLTEVQKSMGHRDIRSTEWYCHLPTSMDQHAAHVSARVFAGAAA